MSLNGALSGFSISKEPPLKTTSTAAQVAANTENAVHSTGPRSDEGKAASSRNNFRHGLAGVFAVLDWEDEDAFSRLQTRLICEHSPESDTEIILVDNMARHQWLLQRAFRLQENCFDARTGDCTQPDRLALFLRYQTTNERAFYKCLSELKRLQNDRRNAQKQLPIEQIGFESQKRKSEMHEIRVELLRLKLANERNKNSLPCSNTVESSETGAWSAAGRLCSAVETP